MSRGADIPADESLAGTLLSAHQGLRHGLIMATVVSVFIGLLALLPSLLLLQLFDRAFDGQDSSALGVLAALGLIALGSLFALDYLRRMILTRVGYWLEARVSLAFVDATITAATRRRDIKSPNPVAHANALRRFVGDGAFADAVDIAWTPVFVIFLFLVHHAFGLLAILGLTIQCVGAFWIATTDRPTADIADRAAIESRDLADVSVAGASTFGPLGMKTAILYHWATLQGHAIETQARRAGRSILADGIVRFVTAAVVVLAASLGAFLSFDLTISQGAMLAATILLYQTTCRVAKLEGVWRALNDAHAALIGITAFAQQPELASRPSSEIRAEILVTVSDVTFRHRGAASDLFRHLDFEVHPGEVLCIVGAPGTGKTTLARLLTGLIVPLTGCVQIGSIDTRHLDHEGIGAQIGYLPEHTAFCPGTIAQNIARMTNAHPAKMHQAARLAGIDKLISNLPRGYETEIGDNLHRLSPRLLRRIALARALYGDPELVVLDEPDPPQSREDVLIWTFLLRELRQRRASVLIFTQSAELIAMCGQVAQLANGRLRPHDGSTSRPQLVEAVITIEDHPRLEESIIDSRMGNL